MQILHSAGYLISVCLIIKMYYMTHQLFNIFPQSCYINFPRQEGTPCPLAPICSKSTAYLLLFCFSLIKIDLLSPSFPEQKTKSLTRQPTVTSSRSQARGQEPQDPPLLTVLQSSFHRVTIVTIHLISMDSGTIESTSPFLHKKN